MKTPTIALALIAMLLTVGCAENKENAAPKTGEINLFANGLGDWNRYKFPANSPRELAEKNIWSYDAKTGVLFCNATKSDHEMLLFKTPFGDGTLSVECRFINDNVKNNSGVFIRTASDSSTWIQAQLTKTGIGMLFGYEKIEGAEKPKRLNAGERRPDLMKPHGEWNRIEVTARGTEVILTVNGEQLAPLKDFQTPVGHIGLEAEFHPIEFRNIRYTPLK